jgi:hypothetical protein
MITAIKSLFLLLYPESSQSPVAKFSQNVNSDLFLKNDYVRIWRDIYFAFDIQHLIIPPLKLSTVESGYNDIDLYYTSSITSDSVVPINSSLLTITVYYSIITTLVYNDTKYSVPFMTL